MKNKKIIKEKIWSHELYINGTSPEEISLNDFSELSNILSDIIGASEKVNFISIEPGSLKYRIKIEDDYTYEIEEKIQAGNGKTKDKIIKLNNFLGKRNLSAALKRNDGATILNFPGIQIKQPLKITQEDQIVGVVTKIGGKDSTIPMTIKTADGKYITATIKGQEKARELAKYLFGEEIRIIGEATWLCDDDGKWQCDGIIVSRHETLSQQPLDELFEDLQKIDGNGWKTFLDPIDELNNFRSEN